MSDEKPKLVWKTWEMIFMDGTTHTTEALSFADAWIIGKIVARQRGTYLFNVREKS